VQINPRPGIGQIVSVDTIGASSVLAVSNPVSLARTMFVPFVAARTPHPPDDHFIDFHFERWECGGIEVKEIRRCLADDNLCRHAGTIPASATSTNNVHSEVDIRAIMDKTASGQSYTGATYLANHDIATYVDGDHPIAHNKVMIIDGETVITGSFNFTRQAENSNAENLPIIQGKPKLAEAYEENFRKHLEHSKVYEGVNDAAPKKSRGSKAN
jgi:hypothetical protein